MADNTKCTPKGIVENLLIKIDKFIFPVDFVILEMVEDFRMPIILGRPLLAAAHAKESYEEIVYKMIEAIKETHLTPKGKRTHWCEAILQEQENMRQYWASCDSYSDVYDRGGLPNNKEKRYWESINDSERIDLEWEELSFNDWDLEECGEDNANAILGIVLAKLDEAWFEGTSEDKDNLKVIIDHLKPKSYDGFIDLDDEAYKERK
ncbi:reverse transcriptase domain-containing protein [Tanacetum coccineum]